MIILSWILQWVAVLYWTIEPALSQCHVCAVCFVDRQLSQALHDDLYKPIKNLVDTQNKSRKPVSVHSACIEYK